MWDYVRAHDVPYNPLHDQGFDDHRLRAVRAARVTRADPYIPSTHSPEEIR